MNRPMHRLMMGFLLAATISSAQAQDAGTTTSVAPTQPTAKGAPSSQPNKPSSSRNEPVSKSASGTVKTQIVTGKRGNETMTEFESSPAASGLQIGGKREDGAAHAKRIAGKNLTSGRVDDPGSENNFSRGDAAKTTIRVEQVIVQSKSEKSKACVQIGVIGKAPGCN